MVYPIGRILGHSCAAAPLSRCGAPFVRTVMKALLLRLLIVQSATRGSKSGVEDED